jgi:glucose-6-phosphate-specific signal transduction histidine kinase
MLKISILYATLMLTSMTLGVILFPSWHENTQIHLIPLVGLGSWIFGRKTGFILILVAMVYSFFFVSIIYPEIDLYYEAKGGGVIIMIVTATLVGNIRINYDAIKTANINLDLRVTERNTELSNLTVKLITDVETTRIRHGQMLHDGIGQQLTGIQLYCTSLAEQLVAESNYRASLAFSMRASAEKAHNIIRKTARMLFPVRMNETGLIPAINELVSCLEEMKHLSIDVAVQGDYDDIPEKLAIGLYRICHETAMCAATGLEASTIHLGIHSKDVGYMVNVRHNGTRWSLLKDNMEQRLILYRLHTLGGSFSLEQSIGNTETIIYRIPKIV